MSNYYLGSDLDRTYYISHHGILGMKWGIRRFQNKDGSLTSAGKRRYDNTPDTSDALNSEREKQIKEAVHKDRMRNDSYYRLDNRKDMSKAQKDKIYREEMEKVYQKMRNNCKTDEEKDRKVASLDDATRNDKWSLDFLEAIQNSGILHDGNTRAMAIEYAKFLDDPEDYWRNGRNKLYEL